MTDVLRVRDLAADCTGGPWEHLPDVTFCGACRGMLPADTEAACSECGTGTPLPLPPSPYLSLSARWSWATWPGPPPEPAAPLPTIRVDVRMPPGEPAWAADTQPVMVPGQPVVVSHRRPPRWMFWRRW